MPIGVELRTAVQNLCVCLLDCVCEERVIDQSKSRDVICFFSDEAWFIIKFFSPYTFLSVSACSLLRPACTRSLNAADVCLLFYVEVFAGRARYTSSDSPERRIRQNPAAAHRRDPTRIILLTPAEDESLKENVAPTLTHRKRTSPKRWAMRPTASKVFTVTGCPRTQYTTEDSGRHSVSVRTRPTVLRVVSLSVMQTDSVGSYVEYLH